MPFKNCPTCGKQIFRVVCHRCHRDELETFTVIAMADERTAFALDRLMEAWDIQLAPYFQEERSRLEKPPEVDEETSELDGEWGEQLAGLEVTKQVLCNLFVVALYHIFEQTFVGFIYPRTRKAAVSRRSSRWWRFWCPATSRTSGLDDVDAYFQEKWSIHFKRLSSWGKISRLRQAANAVKHGEGGAADKLRKSEPKWFPPSTDYTIIRPLGDDDLRIPVKFMEESHKAIKEFFSQLRAEVNTRIIKPVAPP